MASKLLPSARPRCTPPDTNGESSQTWLGWSCNTPEGRNLHLHFRSTAFGARNKMKMTASQDCPSLAPKQCLPCFLKPPPCNCFYSQDKLHPKLHTETPSQISHYTFWQNRTKPLIPISLYIFEWIFFFFSVNYYLETGYPKKQALLLFNHITAYRQLLWDSSLFTVESRITLILNNQKHCEDSTQSMLFPLPEEHIKQKTSVKKHS